LHRWSVTDFAMPVHMTDYSVLEDVKSEVWESQYQRWLQGHFGRGIEGIENPQHLMKIGKEMLVNSVILVWLHIIHETIGNQ
jgi:hypothetical protein